MRRATTASRVLLALIAVAAAWAVFAPVAVADGATAARSTYLAFDGINDHVASTTDPTSSSTTTARTWEARVKTSDADDVDLLSRYVHGTSTSVFHLRLRNGRPEIIVYHNGQYSQRLASTTSDSAADGEWHHVAAVWDPGSRLDVFLDGDLVNGTLGNSTGSILSTINQASATKITLGAGEYPTAGSYFWHYAGFMDDVRYSTGARYAAAGFTPSADLSSDGTTVGLWKLNEGQGTSTATQGQITTDATLTNGPLWEG